MPPSRRGDPRVPAPAEAAAGGGGEARRGDVAVKPEPAPDRLGRLRDRRRGEDRDDAEDLERVAEDPVDLFARRELPGFTPLELDVRLVDEPPRRLERLVGVRPRPGPARLLDYLGGEGRQTVPIVCRPRGGSDPAAFRGDDGGHPLQEVAEVVGEVGVVAATRPS